MASEPALVIKIHPAGGRSKQSAINREVKRFEKQWERFPYHNAYAAINSNEIGLIDAIELLSTKAKVLRIPYQFRGCHGAINNHIDRAFSDRRLLLIEGDSTGLYYSHEPYQALTSREERQAVADTFGGMDTFKRDWGTFAHNPNASASRTYMPLNGIVFGRSGRSAIFDVHLSVKEDIEAGIEARRRNTLLINANFFERHCADPDNQPKKLVWAAIDYINKKHPECLVSWVERPYMDKGLTRRIQVSELR